VVVREIPEPGEGDGSSDIATFEEQPRSDSNSEGREDYGTEREYDDGEEMRTEVGSDVGQRIWDLESDLDKLQKQKDSLGDMLVNVQKENLDLKKRLQAREKKTDPATPTVDMKKKSKQAVNIIIEDQLQLYESHSQREQDKQEHELAVREILRLSNELQLYIRENDELSNQVYQFTQSRQQTPPKADESLPQQPKSNSFQSPSFMAQTSKKSLTNIDDLSQTENLLPQQDQVYQIRKLENQKNKLSGF
jgi:hypothetical protein